MNVVDIPLDRITAAPWNANRMDQPMHGRLIASLGRYGLVQPLLVRRQGEGFETIAGAQRLGVLRTRGEATAPCIMLDDLSDADAWVVSVALNRIGGSDDPNALGAIAREALAVLPAEVVQALLPQSLTHVRALSDLPRIAAEAPQRMAEQLAASGRTWEAAKELAFDRVSFALTPEQRTAVDEGVAQALPRVVGEDPNRRGAALALVWPSGWPVGDAGQYTARCSPSESRRRFPWRFPASRPRFPAPCARRRWRCTSPPASRADTPSAWSASAPASTCGASSTTTRS